MHDSRENCMIQQKTTVMIPFIRSLTLQFIHFALVVKGKIDTSNIIEIN